MRYFTKEMWRGWNSRDEAERQRARELSDSNWQEYLQELEKLESRLVPEAYEFFKSGDRHDGRLISFTVGDAINHDMHGPAKFDINKHDTAVEIKLLAPDLSKLYTLILFRSGTTILIEFTNFSFKQEIVKAIGV